MISILLGLLVSFWLCGGVFVGKFKVVFVMCYGFVAVHGTTWKNRHGGRKSFLAVTQRGGVVGCSLEFVFRDENAKGIGAVAQLSVVV
jgi:hypothetical protein